MKSFQTQTHYEVLEISVGATAADVKSAYERLSNLYSDEQVVLYGLIDPSLAQSLRSRLKEAHDVLSDDARRDVYDVKIGLPPRTPGAKPKPAPAPKVEASAPSWGNYTFVASQAPASQPAPSSYTYVVASPSFSVPTAPMPPRVPLAPAPPPAPPPVVAAPEPPPPTPPPEPKRLGLRMLPPSELEPVPEPPVAEPAPVVEPPRMSPPTPSVEVASEPQHVDATPTFVPVAEDEAIVVSRPAVTREFRLEARPKPYEIPEGVEINGDLLRQVRLARGLTLAQLADRTRIGAKHLENVEGDRYDQLPVGVYLRGILMNLARELGLDGLRVAKSYLTFVEAGRSKG
ncbi:MAG: helix-turn-helix domain-containing protein [Archangium sp.]